LTQPWSTLIAVAVGLSIVWVALLIALATARPKTISVTDALGVPLATEQIWSLAARARRAARTGFGAPALCKAR
jgi:hypothetical protein